MSGLPIELELTIRLLAAVLVGAAVGLEREVHGHPAGLRTQILVAVGSAVFTILSYQGFAALGGATAVDPSRVAAQVVTGIGFLGAGAILKDGMSIRGLTTAASLWGTAALAMAAATGLYWLALAGTVIVLVSLWALRPLSDRLEGAARSGAMAVVRLEVATLAGAGAVREALAASGLRVARMRTRHRDGAFEVELRVRHDGAAQLYAGLDALRADGNVLVIRIDEVE